VGSRRFPRSSTPSAKRPCGPGWRRKVRGRSGSRRGWRKALSPAVSASDTIAPATGKR
jgi:hypothetical protein